MDPTLETGHDFDKVAAVDMIEKATRYLVYMMQRWGSMLLRTRSQVSQIMTTTCRQT